MIMNLLLLFGEGCRGTWKNTFLKTEIYLTKLISSIQPTENVLLIIDHLLAVNGMFYF